MSQNELGIIIPPDVQNPSLVPEETFWERLKQQYPISRIHYPGFFMDYQLTTNGKFTPDQIVYLERDKLLSPNPFHVKGRAESAPFIDGAFDAVFMQDLHADAKMLSEILRTLKTGGLLIYSDKLISNCSSPSVDFPLVNTDPNLEKVKLPFKAPYFTVFEKIKPATSEEATDQLIMRMLGPRSQDY